MIRYNRIIGMMYDEQSSFVSTWNTANTSAGSSTATQVKLPLISTGSYNFVVNWGDGNSDTITAWNASATTHTYSSGGTYTITITGTCYGWQFNNGGDRLKILSVSSWGRLRLGATTAQFWGCSNLVLSSVSDVLDLTGVTAFTNLFRGCSALTTVGRMNEWNTSAVTDMRFVFYQCTLFNQNIGGWNVTAVTTYDSMFSLAPLYNNGGSSDINNWSIKTSGGGVNMSNMFANTPLFNQTLNSWNVSNVSLMNGMFQGANAFNQSLSSWNTSGVTDMSSMFFNNTAFNQDIGSWNVSSVTTFASMFQGSVFNNGGNSNINNWSIKTSGTVIMTSMFRSNAVFNQTISSWNTVAVTAMNSMFQSTTQFNNGYANGVAGTMAWNTTAVTTTDNMFLSAVNFNQDLGNLVLTSCTNFTSMFQGASKFNNGGNSNINNWTLKTTGTVNMTSMFQSASLFNQPLNSWNVSAVTTINGIFSSATLFNQSLSSWNVAAVTDMSNAFADATAFNQSLNSWNVSAVTTMQNMFIRSISGTNAFNQTISSWNTVNVLNMQSMFGASAGVVSFNQDIGMLDVSKVTSFTNFMQNKTVSLLSSTNLDAIYNGWTNRTATTALSITFGTAKYTAAATEGRALLTRTNSTKSITNAVNNGSGLIRISATAHGLSTGNKCFISGVVGTTEANGAWIVTVIDANTIDLQASTFTNTYTSAGTLRTGYGWTITDGGI